MTPDLSLAIVGATTLHRGQVDKGHHPYILHALQVMLRLQEESVEVQCAAVMHDLIEDTPCPIESIYGFFGRRVTDLVTILTRGKQEAYEDYIERVKKDPDAVKIKLADLAENMRTDRGLPDDEHARERQRRYARAVEVLTA